MFTDEGRARYEVAVTSRFTFTFSLDITSCDLGPTGSSINCACGLGVYSPD